jgi:hypothetical protein
MLMAAKMKVILFTAWNAEGKMINIFLIALLKLEMN